jgi:hypothetical protein
LGAMLAHEFQEKRVTSWPVAYEPKKDGIRISFVDGEGYTRNGRTFPTLKPHAQIVAGAIPDGCHLNVEVRAKNWNETSSLLKRIKNIDFDRIREQVVIHIFDAYSVQTITNKEPYSERRKAIEWLAGRLGCAPYRFEIVPSALAHSMEELNAAKAKALAEGEEGIMVKALSGVYVTKRSYDWMKMKAWRDLTVMIIGVTPGWELCRECMTSDRREARSIEETPTRHPDDVKPSPDCPTCHGATKGVPRPDLLGSLVCVDEHGNEWGVGMGFTAEQKTDFMDRRHTIIGRQCDVKIQEEASGESANAITGRHGVFLRFRDDV